MRALADSKNNKFTTTAFAIMTALLLAAGKGYAGATLDLVKEKGFINCGVHSSLPGFSIQTERGYQGFEVDFCRAVAAAVLGDASRVRFLPQAIGQGYTALQSGDIDLLVRHNRWDLTQDTALGLAFVSPLFYDGQAFLVRSGDNVFGAEDLRDKPVCVQSGSAEESALETFSKTRDVNFKLKRFPSFPTAGKAFEVKQCDALTGSLSLLYAAKLQLSDDTAVEVLPDFIERYATGPVVLQGDMEWFQAVRWAGKLLLIAEQLAIGQQNLDDLSAPELKQTASRLRSAGIRSMTIGLPADWPITLLKQVGNYAEIFERNLGSQSPYRMPRSINALVSEGGLHNTPSLN